MARNEITTRQNTQLSAQTAVSNDMTVRMRNGIRRGYSREEAVKAVLLAIKVEQNPDMTTEQIREATLMAVEVVSNSDAMQENGIQEAVRTMQPDPPF